MAPECDGTGGGANDGPATAAGLRLGGSDRRTNEVGAANAAAYSDGEALRQQLQEQQTEHQQELLELQQKQKWSLKLHREERISERTESSAPAPPPTPAPTIIPLINNNSE